MILNLQITAHGKCGLGKDYSLLECDLDYEGLIMYLTCQSIEPGEVAWSAKKLSVLLQYKSQCQQNRLC
jgi:hypothetical protein